MHVKHVCVCACVSRIRIRIRAYAHSRTHARTYTHTDIQTNRHTHIHTNTQQHKHHIIVRRQRTAKQPLLASCVPKYSGKGGNGQEGDGHVVCGGKCPKLLCKPADRNTHACIHTYAYVHIQVRVYVHAHVHALAHLRTQIFVHHRTDALTYAYSLYLCVRIHVTCRSV